MPDTTPNFAPAVAPASDERELLRQAGEALFGDYWQAGLTKALGLSDSRRVRQWLAADDSKSRRPIPPGVWPEIVALLRARSAAQAILAEKIEKTEAKM